jgi:AcrR family transcriptional regulator
LKYQSEKMASRRLAILEMAQALLSQDDGQFTMRELAKKSGVATGTLYNLYGSQDALIADAVADIFERRVLDLATVPADKSVVSAITSRQEAAFHEMMREPLFAKKMVELYFSGDPGSHVRRMLHSIPTGHTIEQLERVKALGDLKPWVEIPRLASQMTRSNYAVVSSWAAEELTNEEFNDEILYATYVILLGALNGPSHDQVKDALSHRKKAAQEPKKAQR